LRLITSHYGNVVQYYSHYHRHGWYRAWLSVRNEIRLLSLASKIIEGAREAGLLTKLLLPGERVEKVLGYLI
jgi:hypothetical protein